MRRLTSILLACSILMSAVSAQGQQRYGWGVSSSSSDPCFTFGNFAPGGIATLYLWIVYANPTGMSAADLSVVINPPGAVTVLAFNTANGYLNAGSPTNLLLAVGGCPSGPVNAGSWLTLPAVPGWEFCLGGNLLTVDCQINPVAWPTDHLGLTNNNFPRSPECCHEFSEYPCGDGCTTTSVEQSSWGEIKGLYK